MGGGSKGPVKNEQEQQAAPAQISAPIQNYAAFSPGQQGLLAQQMQAGYGGSILDQMNNMDFYRDMQVPVVNSPADLRAKASTSNNLPASSLGELMTRPHRDFIDGGR